MYELRNINEKNVKRSVVSVQYEQVNSISRHELSNFLQILKIYNLKMQ
jgi:hypothetical protein